MSLSASSTWSTQKEEFRLCEEFLRNPLKNPETGRKIERGGKKYKEWINRCKKAGLYAKPVVGGIKMNRELCKEFARNPGVNPKSGKKIAIGGPTYKKLLKECKKCMNEDSQKNTVNLEGEYPPPDSNGFVSVVSEQTHHYIVRTLPDRKVYGPLNKYATRTEKRYYQWTWDYKQGHYRPIFMDSKAPEPPKIIPKLRPRGGVETQLAKSKNESKYLVDKVINFFVRE